MEEEERGERDKVQQEDPYAFILDNSRVSASQDHLLHSNPFVGETQNSTQHDMASPVDAELPVASAPILMVSLPDSQDGPQDVFHTPPEESSLPSSDDLRRTLAVDVDVDRCAVNQAVDVDAGTQGFVELGGFSDGSEFVDLGRDSELGFSETQLNQEIDAELVPDCSGGAEGDGLGEIPKCHFDEFGVLEREFSDLGELPVKKLKLSEQNLGFDSSGDCLGLQLQKVEEGMGNCHEGKPVSDVDACNFEEELQPRENALGCEQVPVDSGNEDEISMDKNLGTEENFETEVIQLESVTSAGNVNMTEGNKSSDEVGEGSGMRERSDEGAGLRVLPISISCRLENAANELESREGRKKNKCPVFYLLKALSENTCEVEDHEDDDVSLLEAAKLSGLTFPRPRWWPDHFNSNGQSKETPP